MPQANNANNANNEFKFIASSNVSQQVRIKICYLGGHLENNDEWMENPSLHQALSTKGMLGLYATCALYADGRQLCLPEQTSHHVFANKSYRWDETIFFPIKYKDLPSTAQIAFTIWDIYSPRQCFPIGGTTFYMFGKNRILRKGQQKLHLYPGVEGDGAHPTSTPGKLPKAKEVDRVEKVMKSYNRGQAPHVDWLDSLAKPQVKKVIREDERTSKDMSLFVECFEFEYPVVFKEPDVKIVEQVKPSNKIVLIPDSDLGNANPVEQKYLKLMSYKGLIIGKKDLKPNNNEVKILNHVMKQPLWRNLTLVEKTTMRQFCYYLINNNKALSRFLKCIDWTNLQESNLAVELMAQWEPVGIEGALELLSPIFYDDRVRRYAVARLGAFSTEELGWYLMQLVQTIKQGKTFNTSPLVNLLITRAAEDFQFCQDLFWQLKVEGSFKTSKYAKFYNQVLNLLTVELRKNPKSTRFLEIIAKQEWLVMRLADLNSAVRALDQSLQREQRIQLLRAMLRPTGGYGDLFSFAPFPLPLNPNIEVVGINPENAHIFKSATCPIGLKFRTTQGIDYGVIYKTGDDLRQDQLILQFISIMDRQLKKEVDLKLTPYRVLPTGEKAGMVEQIKSESFAHALKNFENINFDIRGFFRKYNSEEKMSEVLDNFTKSCAGYCVATYILGIGDRHLDNLLLTTSGKLFHIDFGYIFGADPKVFPPPMKLCAEMVETMGGRNNPLYHSFLQYCSEAYNILRKSSNLILTLLVMMSESDISAITNAFEKNFLKVLEKLKLELSDEEARANIERVLEDSVNALFPVIVEIAHKWATYWRN